MPSPIHEVIIETVGSFFLWLLDTCVVTSVIILLTLTDSPDLFQADVSEEKALTQEQISKLPVVSVQESILCGICLENAIEGAKVKQMPSCLHQFHVECIDEWLRRKAVCPYCRKEVSSFDLGEISK